MRLFSFLKRTTESVAEVIDQDTGLISDPVKMANDLTDPITDIADDAIETVTDFFGF